MIKINCTIEMQIRLKKTTIPKYFKDIQWIILPRPSLDRIAQDTFKKTYLDLQSPLQKAEVQKLYKGKLIGQFEISKKENGQWRREVKQFMEFWDDKTIVETFWNFRNEITGRNLFNPGLKYAIRNRDPYE